MIRPFECDVKGWSDYRDDIAAMGLAELSHSIASTIYAETRSKARYQKLLDLKDAGWEVRFQDITVRAAGPSPRFLEQFRRTAEYRGVPFAYPGMRVKVGGHAGVIVGKNDSANFDVYFEEGPHKGLTLNCHPRWKMQYFDKDGKLLFDSEEKGASA